MGLAALRQAAADDFVRVEYIENTSNAYIDTGIIQNSRNYEARLKFQWTGTNISLFETFFGYMYNNTTNKPRSGFHKNQSRLMYGTNNSIITTISPDNNIHEIFITSNASTQKESLYIDNVLIQTSVTSIEGIASNILSMYLFGRNLSGILNNSSLCRIFNFTYTQFNDSAHSSIYYKKDFIPMYQKSRDRYGLWDRVTEEFYTSPNGVKFTGGERVIADANENLYYLKNYVNVSNNQIKDLGFQPVGNDSWEGKFYFIGTGRQDILGAWNSQGQKQYGFMGIDNRQMRFLYNTQTIYNMLSYGNKTFTLKAEKNKFYIYDANNKLIWNSSAIYTSGNNPVRNFIVGHLNGSVYASNARMYYFKYMRGDNLVWDLIPVQRCSDKVWGLFCKVHLGFYPSNGSAQFTGG